MLALPAFSGIIFDLDGTLVNSEPAHFAAWRQILASVDIEYPDHWFEQWIGKSDTALATWIVEEHQLAEPLEEFLERKRQIFREIGETSIQSFPMVPAGVGQLSLRYPLAVATSSAEGDAKLSLRVTDLRQYFKTVVTADDVENLKPAPDSYLLAAERLALPPAQCLAIEDSVSGVAAAKSAGMYTLAVTTSNSPEKLTAADQILPDIATFFAMVGNG